MNTEISIRDFSEYPGLRHCNLSDSSGEEYYHSVLNEAFYEAVLKQSVLFVSLDQTAGFAPSFLDEAFGNLVYDFGIDLVQKHLVVISAEEPDLVLTLENETYIEWQERRLKKSVPKKTKNHKPWWQFVDSAFIKTEK